MSDQPPKKPRLTKAQRNAIRSEQRLLNEHLPPRRRGKPTAQEAEERKALEDEFLASAAEKLKTKNRTNGKIIPAADSENLADGNKRRTLPRADVWKELCKLKFNPIRNMVEMYESGECSEKTKLEINKELLAYIAPKCKQTLEIESNNNPLAELFALVASGGRPLPPTEVGIIEAEARVIEPDDDA